ICPRAQVSRGPRRNGSCRPLPVLAPAGPTRHGRDARCHPDLTSTYHAMHLKRFFVEGLAHASYLFGADGEAAVVDPKRDIEDYVAEAEREGLRITAILTSHPHADFASCVRELD